MRRSREHDGDLDPDLDPPSAFFFFSPGAAFLFGSLEPAMIVVGSDLTLTISMEEIETRERQ
jgi:hypothetical protein